MRVPSSISRSRFPQPTYSLRVSSFSFPSPHHLIIPIPTPIPFPAPTLISRNTSPTSLDLSSIPLSCAFSPSPPNASTRTGGNSISSTAQTVFSEGSSPVRR